MPGQKEASVAGDSRTKDAAWKRTTDEWNRRSEKWDREDKVEGRKTVGAMEEKVVALIKNINTLKDGSWTGGWGVKGVAEEIESGIDQLSRKCDFLAITFKDGKCAELQRAIQSLKVSSPRPAQWGFSDYVHAAVSPRLLPAAEQLQDAIVQFRVDQHIH
jgi:hypothetical protein